MKILIVGAGAVGGYLGAALVRAGRSVTFLVRPYAQDRLQRNGIRIRTTSGALTHTAVTACTSDALISPYDVILLAVRSEALDGAAADLAPAVGDGSVIIPVGNGVAHLDALSARFGRDRVYGGVAQLMVSLDGGVINEAKAGAALQIGVQDGVDDGDASTSAAELTVDGLTTTVSNDIAAAMWSKFAFITAAATMTCLLGEVIGPIARTTEGRQAAVALLGEVSAVAAATSHPLGAQTTQNLSAVLTDPHSLFGPSMYRDLISGRQVETAVLAEFAELARIHEVPVPLVNAALFIANVHNERLGPNAR